MISTEGEDEDDAARLAALPVDDRYEEIKRGEIHIAELQRMTMKQLLAQARKEGLTDYTGLKKQDLIFKILKERTKMNGLMFGDGTLEILPDGFGFLRSPDYHYLPCPDDIYVSPQPDSPLRPADRGDRRRPDSASQRERTLLRAVARRGHQRPGPERAGREGPVRRVDAAAPRKAAQARSRPRLVRARGSSTSIAPIGMGQRGLIVSPPRAGKTILLSAACQGASSRTIPTPTSSCC